MEINDTNKVAKAGKAEENRSSNGKILLIMGIIALIAAGVIMLSGNKNEPASVTQNNANGTGNNSEISGKYETKMDDQADVSIDVTPKELGIDKENNIFEVSINTHTVAMDYDFKEVVTLKDDLGNVYKATDWTGGQGGHHLSGNIIFGKLNAQTKGVELLISGVGGVDRAFNWKL